MSEKLCKMIQIGEGNEEAKQVCESVMDDLCNELLGLEETFSPPVSDHQQPSQTPNSSSKDVNITPTNQTENNEFFKTLSFFDDDPMNDPFESLPLFDADPSANFNVMRSVIPDEFTQPYSEADNDTEKEAIVESIVDNVLDQVLDQGIIRKKIATVHPFSMTMNSADPPENTPVPSLRLAGFAVDPTSTSTSSTSTPSSLSSVDSSSSSKPVLKLANFAVDPSTSSKDQPKLKLANFAVDPGSSGNLGNVDMGGNTGGWHTREGPPPLQQRPTSGPSAPPRPQHHAEMTRQLFSPPMARSPQLPSLTRAPSPHVGTPSPNYGATPPPQSPGSQNVACFGHFERELEYRYCFRTSDFNVHSDYIIFSSLDNVYIKLIVHENGLAGLPREPTIWQSVNVKFMNDQNASWCFISFKTRDPAQQQTIQAELPMDFNHFSVIIQRRSNFILSQSRLNALNAECLAHFGQEISPSFYHVQKNRSFLRPNINNLGNECIDPNISAEDRQKTVQWITTEMRSQTGRVLSGIISN